MRPDINSEISFAASSIPLPIPLAKHDYVLASYSSWQVADQQEERTQDSRVNFHEQASSGKACLVWDFLHMRFCTMLQAPPPQQAAAPAAAPSPSPPPQPEAAAPTPAPAVPSSPPPPAKVEGVEVICCRL